MNKLFNFTNYVQRQQAHRLVGSYMSVEGAQKNMAISLEDREKERAILFQMEVKEMETTDMLDRALLRAHHSKLNGAITAVEYHQIADKVNSLKKLRFVEEYEKLQDRDTFEYMKYKVAAEVGGPEELEAFKLYKKAKIEEIGEEKFRLFSTRTNDHPILNALK